MRLNFPLVSRETAKKRRHDVSTRPEPCPERWQACLCGQKKGPKSLRKRACWITVRLSDIAFSSPISCSLLQQMAKAKTARTSLLAYARTTRRGMSCIHLPAQSRQRREHVRESGRLVLPERHGQEQRETGLSCLKGSSYFPCWLLLPGARASLDLRHALSLCMPSSQTDCGYRKRSLATRSCTVPQSGSA